MQNIFRPPDTVQCKYLLQRWVWAFRNAKFHVRVSTNNGIERQNRCLKHEYLQPYRDSTLTGLATVIVEKYLPAAWLK